MAHETPDTNVTLSRRSILRQAAAALATAPLAMVAGCADASRQRTAPSGYTSWLFRPEAVSDTPHGSFFLLDLETVRTLDTAFARETYVKYTNYVELPALEFLRMAPDSIDVVLQVYPLTSGPAWAQIFTGQFDRLALKNRLSSVFAEQTTHSGYELYWAAADRDLAIALEENRDRLLVSYPTETHAARTIVKRCIDARRGLSERYVDASSAFNRLTKALGSGDDVSGFTHPPQSKTVAPAGQFEGAVAKGHRYRFGTHTTHSRYVFVFETAPDADTATVMEWIDANDGPADRLFGAYHDLDVSRTDRIVVVEGTVPTRAI